MNRLQQSRNKTIGYCFPTLTNDVDELHGNGVISDAKDKFIKKFLGSRPKIINDLIESEGKAIVNKVEICRSPVKPIFEKLINAMSLGMLRRKMKERDYDKLFHLYVILYLSNGSIYRVEKNQRMKIIKDPKKKDITECKSVNIQDKKINFETFITAPERVDMKNLYRYSSFKFNCQNYVKRLTNANGIKQFNDFILQKVKDLAQPIVQKIANGITDVAGVADYVIRGGAYMEGEGDDDGGVYEDILNSS